MDALMVGGRGQVVVMDETVVGMHAADGWSMDSMTISKRGATARRTSTATSKKMIKKGHLKRLPARTVHRGERAQRNSFILRKKPAAANAAKRPAAHVAKKPAAGRNLKNSG
eukprot:16436185-Heterocapsa_arctica.AAC.1